MKTGQLIDLLPTSKTDFAMRFTAGTLHFQEKEPGKVSGFTMELGGQKYPVSRAPAP